MKKNVFLFTGEEKYNLFLTLKKWRDAFIEKYGPENYFVFRSDEVPVGEVVNSIFSGGLFVNKKLIIIYGIPKDSDQSNKFKESYYKQLEEKLIGEFESISDDIVMVLVSFQPDKRTRGYKFFDKNCQQKKFNKLREGEITNFVNTELGTLINSESLNYLTSKLSSDLFSISNEIIKLKHYCENNSCKITSKIIDEVIYSQADVNSFDFLDNMFFNKKKAFELLEKSQKSGGDNFQFLGMIYRGVKIVIQMVDMYKEGVVSAKEMASTIGVHPFVVSKNIKKIKKYIEIENKIKNMFNKLIELDYSIKVGKIPAELFWLEIKNIIA